MALNNNIISLEEKTPADYLKQIANSIKERRLEQNLTQEGLARRSGVKLPTYRRFEQSGEISLKGLLQIAWSLGLIEEMDSLFSKKQYNSISEVISGQQKRQRGKRK